MDVSDIARWDRKKWKFWRLGWVIQIDSIEGIRAWFTRVAEDCRFKMTFMDLTKKVHGNCVFSFWDVITGVLV